MGMLTSIGVLLLLVAVPIFLFGLVRKFFPASEKFIPDDFKAFFTMPVGVYTFLAGLVLLRFF